jgi:Mn2+/Fe2+ NRAMP family transporter
MADLAAMGEALQLLVGGGEHGHALVFGLALAAIQVLFFWQAAHEMEEMQHKRRAPLLAEPARTAGPLLRIRLDTVSGMFLSIKALFYSAVVNGVVAVPIMAMLVLLASRRAALGSLRLRGPVRALAWIATAVMLAAVLFMVAAIWRA